MRFYQIQSDVGKAKSLRRSFQRQCVTSFHPGKILENSIDFPELTIMCLGAVVLATSMGEKLFDSLVLFECNTHALSLIPPVLLQVRILALFENQKRIFLAMCVIDTISFALFILVITLTGGQYSFELCV